MSWLIVGILEPCSRRACALFAPRRARAPKLSGTDVTHQARTHSRKTKSRHPLPGAEGRLAFAEDHGVSRGHALITSDFRSQRQRLSFLRRGVVPNPADRKRKAFNSLHGDPAGPFRRAKLTACRRVGGMYRRYRSKSSRYGHESTMAQAHLRFSAGFDQP